MSNQTGHIEGLSELKAICIVLIVFHHALLPMQNRGWGYCFLDCPLLWPMPFFFFVSGFLLLRGCDAASCVVKIKRRFTRLLWPYLLWNVLAAAYLCFSVFAPSLLADCGANTHSISEILGKVIGFSAIPAVVPFWYIRELLGFVLLLPLLLILLRVKGLQIMTIAVCVGLGLANGLFGWIGEFSFVVPPYSILALMVGASWACRGGGLRPQSHGIAVALVFIGLAAMVLSTFHTPVRFVFIAGQALFWIGLLGVGERILRRVPGILVNASFFILGAHYALLSVLRKMLPPTELMPCLLVGVIDVMLCVVMYQIVHGVTPRFVNLLSGKGFANV